jgi:hypothetical protein
LITHPILRIWPRPPTTCYVDWKNIERTQFFQSWRYRPMFMRNVCVNV